MQIPGDEELVEVVYVPPMHDKYKVGNLPPTPTKETEMEAHVPSRKVLTAQQFVAVYDKLREVFVKEPELDPEDGRQYGSYIPGWGVQRVADTIGGGVTVYNVHRLQVQLMGYLRTHKERAANRVTNNATTKSRVEMLEAKLTAVEANLRKVMSALGIEWE